MPAAVDGFVHSRQMPEQFHQQAADRIDLGIRGHVQPRFFGQLAEPAGPVGDKTAAGLAQQRLFIVELVLDRADDLFEDVFEGDLCR